MNATALLTAVGDASVFCRARDLVAWLGLVPKQARTGGKPKLFGITKRGSRYLRKNLIHGVRAVLPHLAATKTRLGDWLRNLLERVRKNTVVMALANKLARIAWAVLVRGRSYHRRRPRRPKRIGQVGRGEREIGRPDPRGPREVVTGMGPDSRPVAGQPDQPNGPRGRRDFEARAARISTWQRACAEAG